MRSNKQNTEYIPKNYCNGLGETEENRKMQNFELYMQQGSFPYLVKYRGGLKEAREYLRDIYNSVLLKDIVSRLKVADVTTLENVTKFLLHNIGNMVSATKIANTLKSQGSGGDQKTVDKYLRGLTDSLLMYEAQRYNLKGKMFLKTNSKYYVVDVGLRNMLVKGSASDIGHVLENIVFLELKRRGYEVYVGQYDDVEIDFVAINGGDISYYQVATTTLEESVLRRELAPFRKLQDNYPKYLLTLDEVFATADYEGIKKINVIDWLLQG